MRIIIDSYSFPKGLVHGITVLCEAVVFQYKCDEFYHPEANREDGSLEIDWRIPIGKVILSEKGTRHPLLKDFESSFSIVEDY